MIGIVSITDKETGKVLCTSPNTVVGLGDYLKSLFCPMFGRPRYKLGSIQLVTGYPQEDDYWRFPIHTYDTSVAGQLTVKATVPIQYTKSHTTGSGSVQIPLVGCKVVRLECLEDVTNLVFSTNVEFLNVIDVNPLDFLEVTENMSMEISWTFILYE